MYVAVSNMEDKCSANGDQNDTVQRVNVKVPKRILHFSDGTLEEFSDDDETDNTPQGEKTVVDPVGLKRTLAVTP